MEDHDHDHTPSFTAYRLFWYVMILTVAFMGILAALAWFALDTADDVQYSIAQFYSFNKKLFYSNFISYLLLLGIAGYIHRKHGQRRYYLVACSVFLLFSYIGYGLLNDKLLLAYQTFEMPEGALGFNSYLGMLLSIAGVLMAVVVFVGISMKRRNLPLD